MDALILDLSRSASMPGAPPEATPEADRPRRRLAELIARLGRAASGGRGGDVVSPRRTALLAYTGATIVVGIGLLVVTSLASAPWPAIDPGIGPNTVLAGPTGGLLLWLLYGLIGSLRVLRAPGGSSMTFHMPFIGAAMILGGPTAGAWVAFLATIERRELETLPWYGILANHATVVIGAVAGGLAVQLTAALLPPGSGGGGLLAAATAGAVVLAAVSTGIGVVAVMLREGLSLRSVGDILLGQVGRITALECALVVVMALAFLQVGWWAPLLVAGFVLVIWDNDPVPPPSAVSGLPVRVTFLRRVETVVGRLRRGVTPAATVMFIDLDRFKWVNDNHSYEVGNEVLAEVGRRLVAQARRSDDVAGHLEGDEFALLLPGLGDPELAVRRADEIVAALSRPIVTTAGLCHIGASIGVVVVRAWGGVPSAEALLSRAAEAMHHPKRDGGGSHLYDPEEAPVPLGDRRA